MHVWLGGGVALCRSFSEGKASRARHLCGSRAEAMASNGIFCCSLLSMVGFPVV